MSTDKKMNTDKKRLFKEIGIWTGLIIITFIGTSIYSIFKPENVLMRAHGKAYDQTIVARDSVVAKSKTAQEDIDLARELLADFKEKAIIAKEYGNTISTWSQILDEAQNNNISNIKKNIVNAKKANEEDKDNAEALLADAKKQVDTLINSDIKFAKDSGEKLLEELNK